MRCPFCREDDTKVIDSRATQELSIRRRRQCLDCGRRFTTYERVEEAPLKVIKKDGTRVPFHRNKIRTGLDKACYKRSISPEQIDAILCRIETRLYEGYEREAPSEDIGEMVMEELRQLDQVAYVRFASVYRNFEDATDFSQALEPMLAGAH